MHSRTRWTLFLATMIRLGILSGCGGGGASSSGDGNPPPAKTHSNLASYLSKGIAYRVSMRAVAVTGLKSDFSPAASFSF